MLDLLTSVLFLLVAAVTLFLGLRFWAWHTRAVDRLAGRPESVAAYIPSPSLIWHDLVDKVGAFVPASPKDSPLLKRRLVQAGFRNPAAVRYFNAVRWVSTGVFTVLALTAGVRNYAHPDNLFLITAAGAVLGYMAPMQFLQARIRRRKHAIEKGLPNALDLLVVCVESGLSLDQATLQVATELQSSYPAICEELTVLNLEMRAGKRRAEALHNLAERTGVEELKKLVAVLIQTDRFGTSIAQSLRGHSDYMRVMARQRAEERAAKLAVKLVFPIFFCILPSLFVVTIAPVMTHLVRDLLPMINNM